MPVTLHLSLFNLILISTNKFYDGIRNMRIIIPINIGIIAVFHLLSTNIYLGFSVLLGSCFFQCGSTPCLCYAW
jgi:hypothetical protein